MNHLLHIYNELCNYVLQPLLNILYQKKLKKADLYWKKSANDKESGPIKSDTA